MVLNISAVERETGLSKDVLRMWERRYALSQARPRRQRRAAVHGGRDREAAQHQAPDGCRDAPRQDHRAFAGRTQRDGRCAHRPSPRHDSAGARARHPDDAEVARRHGAAAHARQPVDAPGPAGVRPRDDHAAQPCGRRSVDARRFAGVRGTPLHGAVAGGAAHRDQYLPAPGRAFRACCSRRFRPSSTASGC